MRFNIYNLLSLSIIVSKQIIQSKAQANATTNTAQNAQNAQNAQPAQGGITITDEQLKTFSYGAEEFTMAIIGDSGAEKESKEVMKLTTYSALLHLGDYDYECTTNKYFDNILDSNRSYQFMGILGNHEGVSECGKEKFEKYKSLIHGEMTSSKNSKVKCEFSSSKAMWVCLYKNVRIIGLSAEVNGADKRAEQLSFLKKHLNGATEDWKICSWHFYDKYYHTGKYPGDSERSIISGSGESFYDYCKGQGAIILSAHDHVYARTHVMSKFSSPVIDTYDKNGNGSIVQIRKGATLNILNGAGGYEMYIEQGKEKNYSHWQKKYAKGSNGENAKKYGGLFCKFNEGGNPKKASCQFLRINSSDKVFDSFTIYQNENPGTVKYTQIDENFKNEKIKAYKIANNIVDPVPSTTAATPLAGAAGPTNAPSGDTNANTKTDNSDSLNKESKNEGDGLFDSKYLKIGGSICAALVVLGGGVLLFSKNSKKSDDELEIEHNMSNKPFDMNMNMNMNMNNNNNNNNNNYNFSNYDPYSNKGIDSSFAPLPMSTNSNSYQNKTASYDYNTFDRNYNKANKYSAYTSTNLNLNSNSNSNSKEYNYYSNTNTTSRMNNNDDTEPLVENRNNYYYEQSSHRQNNRTYDRYDNNTYARKNSANTPSPNNYKSNNSNFIRYDQY